ncbi:DEAD/DEAH box helicase family protein [Streptomyces sp. NPDC048409]|uniref:DEAD/DEAH box helicase family protein n=1 Tax=Streptomyces sp. NPDC048409 TaxID=3154723 RepID=UPI00342F9D0E
MIDATGSGKTLIGVAAANGLTARRVLVLVPALDLLVQTAAAWRAGGRRGAMIGVCSLRGADSQGLPCTTDPDELTARTAGPETVTVFATYASVGMGTFRHVLGFHSRVGQAEAIAAALPAAAARLADGAPAPSRRHTRCGRATRCSSQMPAAPWRVRARRCPRLHGGCAPRGGDLA